MTATDMRKSDRLIPWYFVIFFTVIFIVDAIFVTIAVRTQTGVVTEHPYEEGLSYKNTLELVESQKALGWETNLDLTDGTLFFKMNDKAGNPLSDATVTAHVTRAVQAGYDFDVPLHMTTKGIYKAEVNFPLPGTWDINIEAIWQNHHYYLKKNVTAQTTK